MVVGGGGASRPRSSEAGLTLARLALKNLLGRRTRSVAILLSAALASGLVFSTTSILRSARSTLEHVTSRLGADIMVVPSGHGPKGRKMLLAGEPGAFYMDGGNLDRVAAVAGVQRASPQLYVSSANLDCCAAPTVLLVGFDPATDFTLAPWVEYVYAPNPGESPEKLDEMRVGAEALWASEVAVQKFYGKRFRITSALHLTGIGFLDYSLFMSMEAARDMIEGSKTRSLQPLQIGTDQISSILVKVDRTFDVGEVAARIEKATPGVEAVTMTKVIASVHRGIKTALWGSLAAGAAFWALMLAATGVLFATSANEREREVGVLRAMGATRRQVLGLVVSEASVLSGLGALAGVGVSLAALSSFRNLVSVTVGMPFSWQPTPQIVALAALCVVLISLSGAVCAALPAGKVCRKEPYEAIWHGMR